MVFYFHKTGNVETNTAVSALSALAQETRLSIFRRLVEAGPEGIAAGRLSGLLSVPSTTLSFHLKELLRAELVTARQDGRFIFYAVNFEQMAALMAFLTHNCCQGMPQECLTVMETELGRCCAPIAKRKPERKKQ